MERPAYVPGRHLHPRFWRSEGVQPSDDAWEEGWDLFSRGFYWEAHEAWEQLWLALGRTSPRARIVQALILVAAAAVKVRQRRGRVSVRLLRRASDKLAPVDVDALESMGLGEDFRPWLGGLESRVSQGVAEENEQRVRVVFAVVLSRGAVAGLPVKGM